MTLGRGTPEARHGHNCGKLRSSLSGANGACWALHHLLDLPDDVIFVILSYCDLQSLGRLSQVCRRLTYLIGRDSVWLSLRKRLTVVKTREGRLKCRSRSYRKLPIKEQCRYATNWMRGHFQDLRLIQHSVKQLPWLQVDSHYVWASYKNLIRCYQQQTDGSLRELPKKMLRGHREDVGRFVKKDNMIVSGSRDRSIHAYSALSGECLAQLRNCHSGDIQAVDCHQDIGVSGSRDASIKIWNLREINTADALLKTVDVNDRVWSLSMNPNGRSYASGTAGINHVAPLRIWDTESGQLLAILGHQYKHGAGVLDIQYETSDILFSCGYDTYTRMWDLRKSHTHWREIMQGCLVSSWSKKYTIVLQWEEPFDSALYCVQTDGDHAVITGTARYGMVRLWDKRHTRPVQLYYTGRSSSPVYSMAYDTGHLYVALDRGINLLDFTIPG